MEWKQNDIFIFNNYSFCLILWDIFVSAHKKNDTDKTALIIKDYPFFKYDDINLTNIYLINIYYIILLILTQTNPAKLDKYLKDNIIRI
jgi:hypothetical protein